MKTKKGFTLIELMVVVAVIGLLSLLGLRLYTGQQEKAKNAVVKANAGTMQTIIQGNMVDNDYAQDTSGERITAALSDITNAGGCRNPYTGGFGNNNVVKATGDSLADGDDIDFGKVAIASPGKNEFNFQGLDQNGELFGDALQAIK